jgi:hypothetical protein
MAMVYQKGTVYLKGTREKKWYGKFRVYLQDQDGKESEKTRKVVLGPKAKMRMFEAEARLQEIIRQNNGGMLEPALLADVGAPPLLSFGLLRSLRSHHPALSVTMPNTAQGVVNLNRSVPGIPGYSHDEPMCLDKTSMQWIKDSLAERPVHIDQIGVMYMFSGAWVPDLHGTSHSADHTYHVGPHAMIITPHNEDLAKFNRDGSTGQIYISHLPGHSELYLIIPFKDWPTQ